MRVFFPFRNEETRPPVTQVTTDLTDLTDKRKKRKGAKRANKSGAAPAFIHLMIRPGRF